MTHAVHEEDTYGSDPMLYGGRHVWLRPNAAWRKTRMAQTQCCMEEDTYGSDPMLHGGRHVWLRPNAAWRKTRMAQTQCCTFSVLISAQLKCTCSCRPEVPGLVIFTIKRTHYLFTVGLDFPPLHNLTTFVYI